MAKRKSKFILLTDLDKGNVIINSDHISMIEEIEISEGKVIGSRIHFIQSGHFDVTNSIDEINSLLPNLSGSK